MCGLAGFINFPEAEKIVRQANKIQQHRGPDGQHQWIEGNIAFAHQRLSIIDLNGRADQPLIKGNLVIIFNGEIYNYQELKDHLLQLVPDIQFKTTSDTEVLLELYRYKKEECLNMLTGMFSFAIFDTETGILFIARDHLGIKPLFYTQIGNQFAFSSELKTLVRLPGFDKTINLTSLAGAMNYLWVPGSITMFEHAHKLPPAHCMTIDTKNEKISPVIQQYWKLPQTKDEQLSESQLIEKLDECMQATIARHMIADVPVSCFLSGGLDSSLISVMASKHIEKLSTYTIATTDEDKKAEQMPEDEMYARKLAKEFSFDHHEILINADIVGDLKSMVYTLDEPIGDPAAINTWLICKEARSKGVKVLLSGMGADEIFFGYRRQKATLIAGNYRKLPSFIRKIISGTVRLLPVKIGSKGVKLTRWAKRFLSFADLPVEESYMRSYSYYDQSELQQLFKCDISQSYTWLRNQHSTFFNQFRKGELINQICHTDLHMFMQGLNLSYTDKASMAASVEVRVPFIDRLVVETAMNMPGSIKYKNKQSKYILKKVAEKYLPQDIIYRPKASFGAPIRSWISGDLQPLVNDLLSQSSVNKRGIFNYDYISKLIENDRSGKEDNAYRLYQLLTVELWFRNFVDQ
ncbi:asparagine synthase (glutamine-hydrolyzing) [Pseudoflavitalea sp. G-6-1-2]|uniref:asparagine synthase (glutamine-hydrolyzing) n=1 Tax=Pseudoflavitalea sp. G-6-1-2 TaxID=2728841 RepID=UPI00146F3E2B|nr:asparagine synthase (glutamine-hydrolyzing) [Pseudoflavitalea sp. G-6-1-2]NML20611.1 asparagine synthase (glutamine-hydrolyzing) [Pseudoflavitalea sp. G-6-1-2]